MTRQWTSFVGIKQIIRLLRMLRLPGLRGFTLYDLLNLYLRGIVKGALTSRAASIAYSFFMALFPFLLFVLNLIPFVPSFFDIDQFDGVLLEFIETLLPADTHVFFTGIFQDIQSKPRGGACCPLSLYSPFFYRPMGSTPSSRALKGRIMSKNCATYLSNIFMPWA